MKPARSARVTMVGLVLATLAACTSPDSPDPDPTPTDEPTSATTSETPDGPSPDDARNALGALDPCALLTTGDDGVEAAFAEGPHTCEGDLADSRITVSVGIPFDEAARDEALAQDVAGLTAYADTERCRTVFPVGTSHGIAVGATRTGCDALPAATALVGGALAAGADVLAREPGPDNLSACRLLIRAVDDPTQLVDAVGTMTQGLDHCEDQNGAVLARTRLTLSYTEVPFDEMARLLKGDRTTVVGQPAVTTTGGSDTCVLHTYVGTTTAEGRGEVNVEAIIGAATCADARSVAEAVVPAAAEDPPTAGSVSDLLVPAP